MNDYERAAVQILQGLVANPSIIAPNPNCGWGLVNMTDSQLVLYATHLAQLILNSPACGCDDHKG
jgi:hypothetical protein